MWLFEIACLAALLIVCADAFMYPRDARPAAPRHGSYAVPAARQSSPSVPLVHTEQGDVLRLHLAGAAFPHAARRNGYRYGQVQYPAYPNYADSSVAIFVPRGFHSDRPVNLVFFFHGWNSSIDDAARKFDLYRQFFQSGAQALLVLPELALNAPDSFGGKLEEGGGFSRMVSELLARLSEANVIRTTRLGGIVLAGHSGAFQVIGSILVHGDLAAAIRGVVLFDGLYALADQYRRWIESTTCRFFSVIAADGEENTDVDALIDSLKNDCVAFKVARDDPASDPQVMGSRVVFLTSSSDHFGVVVDHDEFRRILSASRVFER
jgi:hypothetical protein